jgi:hypothetical protein
MEIKQTINQPHIPLQPRPSQSRPGGTQEESIKSNDDRVRSSDSQYLIDKLGQSTEIRQSKVDDAIRKISSGEYLTDRSAEATADVILAKE